MYLEKDFKNYDNPGQSHTRHNTTLTGILMPCRKQLPSGYVTKNKLRTKNGDYYLKLDFDLEPQVEQFVWEDVQATGYLDNHQRVLEVETAKPIEQQSYLPFYLEDEVDVIQEYQSQIHRLGKLDMAHEEMAS